MFKWDEILQSKVLRYYGSCLALIHVITSYLFSSYRIDDLARESAFPICYPGLEGCEHWRFFSSPELRTLMILYGAFAIATIVAFISERFKKIAPLMLLGLCVFKLILQLSDYRIATNYHFLAQVITFVYLIVPQRIATISILLPGVYFCAGLLKLNVDWLSGETLIKPSIIQGPLLSALLVYVLVLEIFIVWFIFSNKKAIRLAVLIQLIAFHIYSWHIVDYPYPSFMFCILGFFVLTLNYDYKIKENLPRLATIMGLLCLFQLTPYLFAKDPGLDGRSRILSLNMMDVKSVCERQIELTTAEGVTSFNIPIDIKRPRMFCDPQVTKEIARHYCERTIIPGTMKVFQQSRRSTEKDFKEILNYSLQCPGFSHGS
nr:HTTM domain-containing protein [Bacteriovorax sp. HI3]